MNIVLWKAEWKSPHVTSLEIGIRYNSEITKRFKLKNVSIYEIIDEQLFMLAVIKHNIDFEKVEL
jgi:hypothetical protein